MEPVACVASNKPEFHFLDVRARKAYKASHADGAVWVDHAAWAKDFKTSQDPDLWTMKIEELGIGGDGHAVVVIYDSKTINDAARIWWILHYWGIANVRLLNGGWRGWLAADGPVTREVPAVTPSNVKLKPQKRRLATKTQVLDSLKSHSLQIIDTRSEAEYCGTAQTAKRNGAIPGAVHLEWKDVIDPKTDRFKDAGQLARLFRDAHIDLDRPSVTHCQSGGRASVMAFALELMGGKDVRNYYRSWAEWGNANDTPIEKPRGKE
jgi:thiosulfate/3-mercaptopyruvate sulfurtransferase